MIFVLQLKSPAGEPPRFYVGVGSNAPTGVGSADALIAAQFAGKGAACTCRYPPTHVVELHPGARRELVATTRRLIEQHGSDYVFCAVPQKNVPKVPNMAPMVPKIAPTAPTMAPKMTYTSKVAALVAALAAPSMASTAAAVATAMVPTVPTTATTATMSPTTVPNTEIKSAHGRRRWVDLSAANEARISPVAHESRHFTF